MIKKEDLIKVCRYYKGEKENPYKEGNNALFWFYEEKWIEISLESHNDYTIFMDYVDEYISAGLDSFETADKTPITLKALLFNRYSRFGYSSRDDAEPFKEFYIKQYKKGSRL